jgi:hypothetical protein
VVLYLRADVYKCENLEMCKNEISEYIKRQKKRSGGRKVKSKQFELIQSFVFNVVSERKGVYITPNTTDRGELFNKLFGTSNVDNNEMSTLFDWVIDNQSNKELDFLLTAIEYFGIEEQYQINLAKLLTLPWHHFHDRIAGLLNTNPCDDILSCLYEGSTFRCDNLDYESDYCEFNRKCLYALAKNGSEKSREFIMQVAKCDNEIIASHAVKIMSIFNI